MDTPSENSKLAWCESELRALLTRLLEGNYGITAEFIFDHVARSGVDMKLNPELEKLSMVEFLNKK